MVVLEIRDLGQQGPGTEYSGAPSSGSSDGRRDRSAARPRLPCTPGAWRSRRACHAGSRDRPGLGDGQGRRSRAETGAEVGQRAGARTLPGAATGRNGVRSGGRRRHGDTALVVVVCVAWRSVLVQVRRPTPGGKSAQETPRAGRRHDASWCWSDTQKWSLVIVVPLVPSVPSAYV